MKQIKISKWKNKSPEGEMVEDSVFNVINYILTIGSREEKLKGFENMRKMNRISLAIEKAESKSGKFILLEDGDYEFIKGLIEKHAPAVWGSNKDIMNAVQDIMDAKDLEVKEK